MPGCVGAIAVIIFALASVKSLGFSTTGAFATAGGSGTGRDSNTTPLGTSGPYRLTFEMRISSISPFQVRCWNSDPTVTDVGASHQFSGVLVLMPQSTPSKYIRQADLSQLHRHVVPLALVQSAWP